MKNKLKQTAQSIFNNFSSFDFLWFKSYLDQWHHALCVANEKKKILYANQAFKLLFQKYFKARTPDLNLLFEANGEFEKYFFESYKRERFFRLTDQNFQFENLSLKTTIELAPFFKSRNQIIGVAITLYERSNIAPFYQREKQLERMNSFATMALGLAHEIKNPLSGISGAAQLLASNQNLDDQAQKYAQIIEKESQRVADLIADLMNLARPKRLRLSKVNVNHIIHEMLLLQKAALDFELEIIEDYDPSLPKIDADWASLNQVFLNLFKNAKDALKKIKKPKIKIETRILTDAFLKKQNDRRQFVAIEFRDNGLGMDQEQIQNIFTPFFTTKVKGTGLGLVLCHQIIEKHEGYLKVTSKLNQGSCFSVLLPVNQKNYE